MPLPTDDLLSAFHDGEITSAERAAVEQQLADSAVTRRELAEIQQVSALLKELPRERLPSEFPQQVLQAIEREMLIPSLTTDPAPVLSRIASSQSGATRRWIGAAAVLTSAAGLFLLVRAVDDHGNGNRAAVRQLAESSSTPLAQTELADAPTAFGGAAPRSMAADMSDLAERAKSVPEPVATTSAARSSGVLPPAGETALESENLRFDRLSLRDTKIGDTIAAMRTEGTEVAVVWVTVVDRQEGLAGLKLLLANKPIARMKTLAKSDVAAKQKEKDSTDQLHAVFVESNPEQLKVAMQKLRDENFFQSLEIDQPIEIAQLNDVGTGRSLGADKLGDRASSLQVASKADAAKSLPGAGSSTRRVGAPDAPNAEKRFASAPAAKGPQVSNEQLPMQITFDLSREALAQNSLNQQSRNRGASRNLNRGIAEDNKAASKLADEQRPMQVLFVVVEQAPAGKQVPSSNAPKANIPAKTRTEPTKPAGQDGAA